MKTVVYQGANGGYCEQLTDNELLALRALANGGRGEIVAGSGVSAAGRAVRGACGGSGVSSGDHPVSGNRTEAACALLGVGGHANGPNGAPEGNWAGA